MQPSTEALQQELGRLLGHVNRVIRSTEGGASRGEFNVLALLDRRGPQRSRDLADAEGMDASTMSRRIAGMEERGLVERVPDASDGRAFLVRATDEGVGVFRAEAGRRLRLITDHVAGWEVDDVAHLATLLARLNDSFEVPQAGGTHD
ncbi:MAG TPA: MarR family transcriptional regulator [Propionibacterium sp.]|nr:MarR family transcriptional regulator [Propionibacterium sp.]